MKQISKKIILGAALIGAFALGGCKSDYLNTEPRSKVVKKEVTKNTETLTLLLNGLHSKMYTFRHGYAGQDMTVGLSGINVFLDLLGDDMIPSRPDANYLSWWQHQNHILPNSGFNGNIFDFFYALIAASNDIIAEVDGFSESEQETGAWKRLKAGGYAFRAYSYLYLVQLYGPRFNPNEANDGLAVALRLVNTKDPMPLNTVAEIYEQINKDLDVAESFLEDLKVDTRAKNQWNYATLMGIRARTALAQHNFAKAAEYAKKGIDRAKQYYGAALATGEELLDGFRSASNKEWLWGYKPTADQYLGYLEFNATFSYNASTPRAGSFHYAVNRDLYDLMGEQDVRRKWWVCLDLGMNVPSNIAPVLVDPKYLSDPKAVALKSQIEEVGQHVKFAGESAKKYGGDHPIMRLGELYYIWAEGLQRSGDDAGAVAALEEVMLSRDPAYRVPSDKQTRDALLAEIRRNKRIDLWMEGQRFFDLKRDALPIVISETNGEKLLFLNTLKEGYGSSRQGDFVRNVSAHEGPKTETAVAWQFALPLKEMENNPYIK